MGDSLTLGTFLGTFLSTAYCFCFPYLLKRKERKEKNHFHALMCKYDLLDHAA